MSGDGELDDFGAAGEHGLGLVVEVVRRALEIVMREHDAPPAGVRHQVRTTAVPFEVDVLGAKGDRLGQDPAALVFAALEHPPVGLRPAGDDHGLAPARERRRRARIADGVEPELHQVGIAHLVAPRTQLGHGVGRHGRAELRGLHLKSPNKKAPLPGWAKRRFGRALFGRVVVMRTG
jgi:hypothetical protein